MTVDAKGVLTSDCFVVLCSIQPTVRQNLRRSFNLARVTGFNFPNFFPYPENYLIVNCCCFIATLLTTGASLVVATVLVAGQSSRRVGAYQLLLTDDRVVTPRVLSPGRLPRHSVTYLYLKS